jgi:predicted phage replisome organizer
LGTNWYQDEKIRLIMDMPAGHAIVNIWFMLLALSGKSNMAGEIFLSDRIAYTPDMLATLFGVKVGLVRLALKTFEEFGMIEIPEDGKTILITNWWKWQNLEGLDEIRVKNAERKRAWRAKKAEEKLQKKLLESQESTNTREQAKSLLQSCPVTRPGTGRGGVTQKNVTVPQQRKNKSTEVPSLPSLPEREKPPADSGEFITGSNEAKRVICERILNGKDPTRPWSYEAMHNLDRQLPIPRIEIERIAWFRGLSNDGSPELEARKPITENGLTAYWSDEVTRANAFWNKLHSEHRAEKKEPPRWREFYKWKYGDEVVLPLSFWQLSGTKRDEYDRDFQTFEPAR